MDNLDPTKNATSLDMLEWIRDCCARTVVENDRLPCRVDEMTPREHAIFVQLACFASSCKLSSEWAEKAIEKHQEQLREAEERGKGERLEEVCKVAMDMHTQYQKEADALEDCIAKVCLISSAAATELVAGTLRRHFATREGEG